MILSKQEILELTTKEKLVEDFIDLKIQLQPASIDLTLAKAYAFEGTGVIDFDNSKRVLSKTREMAFDKGFVDLEPGVYKIQFNETVRIPSNIAAFTTTRSTLARCGAFVHVGWWDPGYHGKGEALLSVGTKLRLEKNARVAQMVFLRLSAEAQELYSGVFHKENV
ncbi:MAG TPA: deoxyuridine 5'-triphosphate nucleotidohydrolase [Candidatus Norongarragalinales archaeon]|nr:deoxyuridine 5'-triphosphate nucleotidohydrolase [Candidatus Norongarragalinales archaeon]